jgi:hypothetical protein
MKRNHPHRKVVTTPGSRDRLQDLARRYREVCELRRKLQVVSARVVSAEAASFRSRKIEA